MHPNEATLNELVDNTLGPSERADVERHLDGCSECRALADDLREIRQAARSLELREPPVRAWTRIERAVRLEADHKKGPYPFSAALWLAAAAVVLFATVVGFRLGPFRSAPQPAAPSNASPSVGSQAAQSVEAELRQAEAHYEKAIQGLEQIAAAERGALDPRTAATLQKNLSVIDQAISESRAALRVEPTSEPAQQSLIDSFKTKIGLLQDTVALINEMRKKGN